MRDHPALALLLCLCLGCGEGGRRAGPDALAAQRTLYALAPTDARGAFTVARIEDLVERLRALDGALAKRPTLAPLARDARSALRERLGFDPLEGGAFTARGIDPGGALAIFWRTDGVTVAAVVRDRSAFEQAFAKAPAVAGPAAECTRLGELLRCSRPAAGPPSGALESEVEALAPGDARAVDVSLTIRGQAPLWLAAALPEGAVDLRARMGTLDTPLHALRAEAGPGDALELLPDAAAIVACRVKPSALWARLWPDKPAVRRTVEGALQLATGLDPERDLLPLWTGRVAAGSTQAGAAALLLETNDRTKTARLVASLQDLLEGAVRGLRRSAGLPGLSAHREEVAGLPVLRAELRQHAGEKVPTMVAYLAAVPRGILVSTDAATIAASASASPPTARTGPRVAGLVKRPAPLIGWALVDDPLGRAATREDAERALASLPARGLLTASRARDVVALLRPARELAFVIDATETGVEARVVVGLEQGDLGSSRAALGPLTLALAAAPYGARLLTALEHGQDLEQAVHIALAGHEAPPRATKRKKRTRRR